MQEKGKGNRRGEQGGGEGPGEQGREGSGELAQGKGVKGEKGRVGMQGTGDQGKREGVGRFELGGEGRDHRERDYRAV